MENANDTPTIATLQQSNLQCKSHVPSIRVVVAHYNESLNWIRAIPDDYEITISYAGNNPIIPQNITRNITIEKTDNGGKDCGQWIRWIAKHYEELDDIIIFLQGAPYKGHTSEILLYITRDKITSIFDYFLSQRPFHKSVGKGEGYGTLTWMLPQQYHVDPFSCGVWGSQHYVTREVIHRRPREVYENLAKLSLELPGIEFCESLEHYFNVIYGVNMEEVQ
jgi:hypothetical protein